MSNKFSRSQLDALLASGSISQETFDGMIDSGSVTAGRGGSRKPKYTIVDANGVTVEVGITYHSQGGGKGFKVSNTQELEDMKAALDKTLAKFCAIEEAGSSVVEEESQDL